MKTGLLKWRGGMGVCVEHVQKESARKMVAWTEAILYASITMAIKSNHLKKETVFQLKNKYSELVTED